MNWVENISEAIKYIEDNIMKDISVQDISNYIGVSPFYFQKGFSFLAGIGVAEYIRKRRLSLAGSEIINSNAKIIDIAMKYGYDSPDSFTKAFTRFHGSTPKSVRKGGNIKEFAPLKINVILKGGYTMEYKIVEKEAFKVVGLRDSFKYETAYQDVPKIWKKFFMKSTYNKINAKYAVNIDTSMGCDSFDYIIGDDYNSELKVPKDFEVIEIPKLTWIIFPCIGKSSMTIKETNEKIFNLHTELFIPLCRSLPLGGRTCGR